MKFGALFEIVFGGASEAVGADGEVKFEAAPAAGTSSVCKDKTKKMSAFKIKKTSVKNQSL